MDYRVCSFLDSASIKKVGIFSAHIPLLDIRGKGFRNVEAVLVNGYKSPTFVVMTPKKIYAEIPSQANNTALQTVSVLKTDPRGTDISVISFESSLPGQTAAGRLLMVQRFLMRLLTTPGSDIFSPTAGGGIQALIGSVTSVDGTSIEGRAQLAVTQAVNQLIGAQTNASMDLTEKIRSATVLETSFSASSATLDIRLTIESMDGTSVEAGLSL
tara:strand:- start:700 stop:1341 length:642 start_codon:yes stop_codon:yes gene_type:complete